MEVKAQVLAATVANFSSQVRRSTPIAARLRLLSRVALPVLDYRATRWPRSPTLSRQQDTLQRRCLNIAAGVPRKRDEQIDEWQRRRSRHAGGLARRQGLWSERQYDRMLAWREHVERAHQYSTIPSAIWVWRDDRWRRAQRLSMGSRTAAAGRLGTRVITHVFPRWEDAFVPA